MIFLFVAGPTLFELNLTVDVIGSTIQNFIGTALNADAFDVGNGWSRSNTIFFMAWIMAYAPLIGCFLAKISRGRTIRQFILINILVPGTFVLIWFVAFGGNAIYQDAFNGANIIAEIEEMGFPVANFALLGHMPLQAITIPITILALFFSFITLADAMTGTGIQTIPFGQDRLVAILPLGHELAGYEKFPTIHLIEQPYIGMENGVDGKIAEVLQRNGTPLNVKLRVKDDFETLAIVESGLEAGMRTKSWTGYAKRPNLCLYSRGLKPPRDSLIRLWLYQWI